MTESTLAAVVQAAVAGAAGAAPAPTDPPSPAGAAPADQAIAAARAEGDASGRAAERARVKDIIGSAEAKGREGLAEHLAFSTDMAPDAAVAALKSVAKAVVAPQGSALDAVVPDPQLGAGAPQQTQAEAMGAGLAAAVDRLIKR
ncbi:hypothetical protein [Xanthobacter sediminis]